MNEESIFAEAHQMQHADLAAFLDERCRDNAELRKQVEALLQAHEHPDPFLDRPAQALLAKADDASEGECPGTVIGPYKLLEQIGEGGFGLVFMAEQNQPVRRKVALKILKPGMDTRHVVARFEAERQALAMMEHPNIAKVFDGGATSSGRPYFVMELVRGIPITDFCDHDRLTPRQRLQLFIPVCQAVQHAHQKGIIHRDLKPANILVTLHDGAPVARVIDFGIAKALGQPLTDKTLFTSFAQMIGTPTYMSPEQAQLSSLDVDTRTDVYALGVLLYELLTGTTPFTKERLKTVAYDEMRRIIREEEPAKPSTRISTLGQAATTIATQRKTDPKQLSQLFRGELDWIVMKALEKDRNRRYESASAFAADVQHYLNDEPIQACPPSAWYRFRKLATRNKALVTTTALVTLAFLLAAGTLGWAVRDRQVRVAETEQAEASRRAAIAERVTAALGDATQLQQQAKWSEALEAVKRAEGILAGGGDEALRAQAHELHKDLQMVLDLEEIRLPRAVHGAEGGDDQAWANASFAENFRNYGIDIEALDAAEAAARIRARTIWPALVTALDNWADLERRSNLRADGTRWKKLLAVARTADPDEWRDRIRGAWQHGRTEILDELAARAPTSELPLQTWSLLGLFNWGVDKNMDKQRQLTVLRIVQRKFPGDYWINFKLAYGYDFTPPPDQDFDEAIRFYTAALAARPRNVPTHMYLGLALLHRAKFEEGFARLRGGIELKPDDTELCNTLAWELAICVEPRFRNAALAIELANKAVELVPKKAEYWNTLGVAHYRARNWDEAIACLDKAEALAPDKYLSWNSFFLAMAHARLGEKELARKEFDRAVQWMEKKQPKNEELRSFRGEAADLLGIKDGKK
jgi:serine/threonine protein kinase/tetratricopeptide (TPR) repeat protein